VTSGTDNTDETLVAAYLRGEETAFARLVERYTTPIYRFLTRLTGDPATADDLSQEAFLRAWRKLESFDQTKKFSAWLFAIARNVAFDHLRKRRIVVFSELPEEVDAPDAEPLPDEVYARAESADALAEALAMLPPDRRALVLMHDEEELTFEEIGEVLGKPMNTVKSQYRRALEALRTLLAPKGP
jgi:RNA polymerase sigma-70 factor (ECF subfamily)